MRADDGFGNVADMRLQVTNGVGVFAGQAVTHGVGDVHGGGARFDRGFDDFRQERQLGAAGVFGGKLHVVGELAGAPHAGDGALDNLGARELQLELPMYGAGGEEHMDAAFGGRLEGFAGAVDVAVVAAREGTDGGAGVRADFFGDGADGLEIAGAGDREPGLDDVHAQLGERPGDLEFFAGGHAAARRLLPVPQGGVEDQDAFGGHRSSLVHRAVAIRALCQRKNPKAKGPEVGVRRCQRL